MAAKKPAKGHKAVKASEPDNFDTKANKQKTLAEREARKQGKKVDESRYIVAQDRTVLKGGVEFTSGEAIDLTEGDAERMLHTGDVLEAGSKEAKEAEAIAAADADNG